MAVRLPALVNPLLLIWAREEAGYSLAGAAERAGSGFTEAKLQAWERGETQPTIRQAERLAKIYERPFSIFSLLTPPKLPPLSGEYRRLPGVRPGEEVPELRLAVRRLVQRRRIALHLFAELGDDPPDFPFRAQMSEPVEVVGDRLREMLAVTLSDQFNWPSEYAAYRIWRGAVERLGILVCQMPGKGLGEIRGTSIIHFPLPVIGINSKELSLSKAFTLLHEVVHLALTAANKEVPALNEKRDDLGWQEVERFCEGVVGAILMPGKAMQLDEDVSAQRREHVWDIARSRRVAKRFRVTPTAIATRLLRLGFMPPAAYAQWKEDWLNYCAAHPEHPRFGIATPTEKAVSRNGPLYTSLVLGALNSDRISSVDASHYLDLGFEYVETLRRDWIEKPAALAALASD